MSERHEIFLRFPDAETAVAAAKAIGFSDEDAIALPPDGWWNGYYFAIDVCFGNGTIPDADGTPYPGYHVNGLWFGPLDAMPDFGAARIYPVTPGVRFG